MLTSSQILLISFPMDHWIGASSYFIFHLFHFSCSKDPGYVQMNVHDPQNMKDDVRTVLFYFIYFFLLSSSMDSFR